MTLFSDSTLFVLFNSCFNLYKSFVYSVFIFSISLLNVIVLFSYDDIKTINYFIENIDSENMSFLRQFNIKRDNKIKLEKMIEFCTTKKCLHKYLVNYFDQDYEKKCLMCSNCIKE